MNTPSMIKNLIEFGLTENEARVYLASVSLGPSTALHIAKTAEMNRTTIYPLVESLKAKGLMSMEIRGLKRLFAAEHPSRLEHVLELKKETLKKALPELAALYDLKEGQSFIKYYDGVSGVKTVYDTILDGLKADDEYLIISNMNQFLDMDRDYFPRFIERRAKLKLKIRALFQDTESGRHYKSIERNTNQEIRFLPPNTNLHANLVILPQKIVVTQIVPPIMCTVIENKSIVDMHRQQFNIIWEAVGT